MLSRLGRWLRASGQDVLLAKDLRAMTGGSTQSLVDKASREGRLLLTRSRRLEGKPHCLFVDSTELDGQLAAVHGALGIDPLERLFSRCMACNEVLEEVSKEAVLLELPAAVRARQTQFRRCPGCRRLYWEGSHTARIEGALHVAPWRRVSRTRSS
jgi:hypothetical protein